MGPAIEEFVAGGGKTTSSMQQRYRRFKNACKAENDAYQIATAPERKKRMHDWINMEADRYEDLWVR